MTTTATAAQSTGLVVMLEAAGRTIAGLERRAVELEQRLGEVLADRDHAREHAAELRDRVVDLEERLELFTGGDEVATVRDGAPAEATQH